MGFIFQDNGTLGGDPANCTALSNYGHAYGQNSNGVTVNSGYLFALAFPITLDSAVLSIRWNKGESIIAVSTQNYVYLFKTGRFFTYSPPDLLDTLDRLCPILKIPITSSQVDSGGLMFDDLLMTFSDPTFSTNTGRVFMLRMTASNTYTYTWKGTSSTIGGTSNNEIRAYNSDNDDGYSPSSIYINDVPIGGGDISAFLLGFTSSYQRIVKVRKNDIVYRWYCIDNITDLGGEFRLDLLGFGSFSEYRETTNQYLFANDTVTVEFYYFTETIIQSPSPTINSYFGNNIRYIDGVCLVASNNKVEIFEDYENANYLTSLSSAETDFGFSMLPRDGSVSAGQLQVGFKLIVTAPSNLVVNHYELTSRPGTWTTTDLAATVSKTSGDRLGEAVCETDGFIYIASPNRASNRGSIFVLDSSTLSFHAEIYPSQSTAGDQIGLANGAKTGCLSCYGNDIIIGSQHYDAESDTVVYFLMQKVRTGDKVYLKFIGSIL